MGLVLIVWTIIIWMPAILILLRQGALLTAGRSLAGYVGVLRFAARRTHHGLLIAIVPLACSLAIGLLVMLAGLVSRLLAAIICVAGGLLIFGANFAVPLGWAALVNEHDADSLDSLSRGYEYLYRRPLRLAMYVVIAIIPLWVTVLLAEGVAAAAAYFAATMLNLVGVSEGMLASTLVIISMLPWTTSIILMFGLLGGIYLLMRQDANGQEVEDLWIPPVESEPPLPKLPNSEESQSNES